MSSVRIRGRALRISLAAFAVLGACATLAFAADFYPLGNKGDNWENRTGLWACPNLEGKILPLAVRLYATKESVTDGVALRVDIRKGSKGTVTYEDSGFKPGTAGLTLYVKASEPLTMTLKGKANFKATTDWQKIDVPWEKLGTTGAKPDLGWQFTVGLAAPAERDCWVIIDRLGVEGPEFIANPPVTPTAGPDPTINTKDVAGNAAVLAPAVQRLKAKKPFKIVAFGDSVTAGAQALRGNWDVKPPDAVKYLYFAHLARLLEERYGYAGITPVQCGFGGWTAEKAKTIVAKEMEKAGPDDVVILEFGANDLGWAYKDVNRYVGNMRDLIAEAKKKTSQIIIMSPTTGGNVPSLADEISRGIRKLAEEQKVAYVDITKWSMYRGEKFAWAYLANDYHPDFMGHIMIAELMVPLFTGENFDWPEYVKK